MKDVQATGEALSPQQTITSSTSKHEISALFLYFCGSILPSWIQIRPTKINADPCVWEDPHHLFSAHEKNEIQTWDSTRADGQCIMKYYVCCLKLTIASIIAAFLDQFSWIVHDWTISRILYGIRKNSLNLPTRDNVLNFKFSLLAFSQIWFHSYNYFFMGSKHLYCVCEKVKC